MESVYKFNTPQYNVAPAFVPLAAPNQKLVQAGIGKADQQSQGNRTFRAYYGMADQANQMLRELRTKIKGHMQEFDSVEDYQRTQTYKDDMNEYHAITTQMGQMQARTETMEEYKKKLSAEQLSAYSLKGGYATNALGQRYSDKELKEQGLTTVGEAMHTSKMMPLYTENKKGQRQVMPLNLPDAANVDARIGDLINKSIQGLGWEKLENIELTKDGKNYKLSEIYSEEDLYQLADGGIASLLRQRGFESKENYDQISGAIKQAVGDLSREEYGQMFYRQKEEGLNYNLPEIKRDSKGKIEYDDNGNIEYVKKESKDEKFAGYEMEQRAIEGKGDFNYWAQDIIRSGVSKSVVNEKLSSVTSTSTQRPGENGGSNSGKWNKYDATQGAMNAVYESGTTTAGPIEVTDKILSVSGISDQKRGVVRSSLITNLESGLEKTLSGHIKDGYTYEDVLDNYDNPSAIKNILTDEGFSLMKETFSAKMRKQLDTFVAEGIIGEGAARDVLISMLEGKKPKFNPSEWELRFDNKNAAKQISWESYDNMYDLNKPNRQNEDNKIYTNGDRTITVGEYRRLAARDALQRPLSHVKTSVLMQNEIGTYNHNQSLYSDTRFQYTNLMGNGTNFRYLGKNINSNTFTNPVYAVESSKFYSGLRPEGKLTLGTSLLMHEDDMKNIKGSIIGPKGEEIEFDLSKKSDREKLKIHQMSKGGRYNIAASTMFNQMLKDADDEKYFIVPGMLMDHDPYPEASVDKDRYTPPNAGASSEQKNVPLNQKQ